jgi:hypothetical protein
MEYIPVKVECHSGFKAGEYPRKFIWGHIDFEIFEVIDRWYEGYYKSMQIPVNYYKVKTDLKGDFLLRHEIENDQWFLVV